MVAGSNANWALESLWLIPFFPLVGALLLFTWGRIWQQEHSRLLHWVPCGSVFASFLLSCAAVFSLKGSFFMEYFVWMPRAGANFALMLDGVNATLLLVVTGIGTLIHAFSTAYLHGESGQGRYFAAMNLFVFFMLLLLLADNYLLVFVGWEGVGLCSYLLIGHYYQKPSATAAAMKAFLMNRIGDTGFLLAMFGIWACFGTLTFRHIMLFPHPWLPLIAAGLFLAATGKSAQLPLFTWLPDAMEGPTPVSALIHAATMVTAGVYLLARSSALLALTPEVNLVIAVTGTLTAFLAATIALAQHDIKKVLAYSTVSQLGFMVAACGAGGYQAAMFHVFTHAFFKALLFLGAGVVIHALHGEQDLRRMGGLNQSLPRLFILMVVGALALSGIPPFAGFFSKDLILHSMHEYAPMLYYLLLFTAFLTAMYMGRFLRLIFLGLPRVPFAIHRPHKLMNWTLLPLGFGALFAGLYSIWVPGQFDAVLAMESSVLAAFGFFFSLRFSLPLPSFLEQAWHWDELYRILFVRGLAGLGSRLLATVDRLLIDAVVNGAASVTRRVSSWSGLWDRYVVDGAVRGTSLLIAFSSFPVRYLQSGVLHGYALWFVLSLVGLVVFLAWGQVE